MLLPPPWLPLLARKMFRPALCPRSVPPGEVSYCLPEGEFEGAKGGSRLLMSEDTPDIFMIKTFHLVSLPVAR